MAGISVHRTWLLFDTMVWCFIGRLVECLTGGHGEGGTRISNVGRNVLERYREMEQNVSTHARKPLSGSVSRKANAGADSLPVPLYHDIQEGRRYALANDGSSVDSWRARCLVRTMGPR